MHNVARLVAQVGDQFCAWMVGQANNVQHQSQLVAEHFFIDVHMFGREQIGVVQRVEFAGIVEVTLDEVDGWRVGVACLRRRMHPLPRP